MTTLYFEKYEFNQQQYFLAGTAKGLSFVGSPNGDIDEIHDFITDATLVPSQYRFAAAADYLTAYLSGQRPAQLPAFDWQSGTALQQQVWQALLTIPYGETRTYQELAVLVGHPTAVRAVATAVAKNPLLIVIPCHRIVRSDHTTGQYRAGAAFKQDLLDMEARQHA
ncbi:methylated-DNA--[protein]-cysteine S-methyltransferase [Loigolactobacillus bifermentans]|nr:methylated-DNA--[protein]-cysteine S-methyltransferase [Loigolactobacillus bifermentans]QGG61380.1 methylated-DNA--[protein]-cysteine S-methyltransferase [Loigolactobacillus bifermentans]